MSSSIVLKLFFLILKLDEKDSLSNIHNLNGLKGTSKCLYSSLVLMGHETDLN